MKYIYYLIPYSLAMCLFLSSFSQAEEDIIFSLPLPSDHKFFKIGEEILTEISSRMDKEVSLISIPGKRSSILLKNNKIHAELARVGEYYQKVPFSIKISEPIFESRQYAYSSNPNIVVSGWGSLKGYRSVAVRGSWIIDVYMAESQVTWVSSIESAVKFLATGRADVLVSSSIRADNYLASLGAETAHIRRLKPAINIAQDFTYFNPEYPKLALRYEEALKAMKADGSYKKILSKAGM